MHGFNEAFLRLSCQGARKLLITVKKILRKTSFSDWAEILKVPCF